MFPAYCSAMHHMPHLWSADFSLKIPACLFPSPAGIPVTSYHQIHLPQNIPWKSHVLQKIPVQHWKNIHPSAPHACRLIPAPASVSALPSQTVLSNRFFYAADKNSVLPPENRTLPHHAATTPLPDDTYVKRNFPHNP